MFQGSIILVNLALFLVWLVHNSSKPGEELESSLLQACEPGMQYVTPPHDLSDCLAGYPGLFPVCSSVVPFQWQYLFLAPGLPPTLSCQ